MPSKRPVFERRYINTRVFEHADGTTVQLHHTDIVTFNEAQITLHHAGWRTSTTKKRMNEAADRYELGYSVYQKKRSWYVDYCGQVYDFDRSPLILHRSKLRYHVARVLAAHS